MSLTKDQILTADDLPCEEVPVPEWAGSVWVRTMTAGERDAWEVDIFSKDADGERSLENLRARLCVRCVVDDKGTALFSGADIPALSTKSSAAVDRIYDVATKLNGLTTNDVEELAKNLPSDQDGDSPSS